MTTYQATYCPRCGTELGAKHVDGRDRQYCASCDRVEWRNPVPCAGVAVVDPERGALLTRRDVEPGVGKWTLAGGHMEVDESPPEAAARELEEETNVRVDPADLHLLDAYTISRTTEKHVVSIGYVVPADATAGTPEPGPEVQTVEWLTPGEFAASDRVYLEPHDQRFERAWTHVTAD
ncbi:NUDIX domain-containing protein [Halorubellus sp. PRR65]|uniref:NUDIX hydrolase n=1 Tax=Halorubellus sp. PRR65 TaxID=3098148 RepID=UPI002B25F50D|nr:NUDIX domain-containing protein [Halorubellus sp. PRR65]